MTLLPCKTSFLIQFVKKKHQVCRSDRYQWLYDFSCPDKYHICNWDDRKFLPILTNSCTRPPRSGVFSVHHDTNKQLHWETYREFPTHPRLKPITRRLTRQASCWHGHFLIARKGIETKWKTVDFFNHNLKRTGLQFNGLCISSWNIVP